MGREEITSLDEMTDLGFERSTLRDPDAMEYRPGPDDGSYGLLQEDGDGYGSTSYDGWE
jgi:hypothetical protein